MPARQTRAEIVSEAAKLCGQIAAEFAARPRGSARWIQYHTHTPLRFALGSRTVSHLGISDSTLSRAGRQPQTECGDVVQFPARSAETQQVAPIRAIV